MDRLNLFNYLFTNYGTNPWTRDSMIKLINSNSSFYSTFKTSTFSNGDTIPFYLGSPCFQQKVLQRATAQQLFYAVYESNSMDAVNFLEQNGKFNPIFMDQLSVNCLDFLTRWDAFNPMFVDMFYTSFFGMPNPDPVMRRNMICSNSAAFNAFKMQRLMDMPTFKSFLMSKYSKQEIWNALPNPFDLIANLISYPNMALRLLSSSQYYVIMQTFNAMTNSEFLTCFYQFRPQNYFSYVYSLGQLGSIFAKGYPIMTFMSDFARNNPSQIEVLWNAMLGTYGQYYSSFQLSELDIYGAKRLGTIQDTLKLNSFYFNGSYNAASNSYNISSTYSPNYTASANNYLTSFTYGKKQYEITNHLGNVLSTVSDYKLPYLNGSGKLCYNPDVRSENKYYAFGGAKDGNWSVNNYAYGYQGSMKNNGLDGTINTFYRQGDVEGLFWLTYDSKSKASESGYILMGNNPILKNDILGDVDRPEFGGAINASFNLSSSSYRLSTSFGCSLKDGNKMGGLNVSFSMYNTGLGTNSGNSKMPFKMMKDLTFSPSFTYGGGKGLPLPLNTFNANALSGLMNSFNLSGTVASNFVFNNAGRNQRSGYLGAKLGNIGLNMYNDFFKLIGDKNDRWWTGGGSVQFALNIKGSATLSTDVFTGSRMGKDIGGKWQLNSNNPANGKYGTYAQTFDNQQLNNGQTVFKLFNNTMPTLWFSSNGSLHMYSQDLIHNNITKDALFFSSAK